MKINKLNVEPKIDLNMNLDYEQSNEVLENGFDSNYPIIIDEEGWILDGNHRYEKFEKAGRLNEVEFLIVTSKKWFELIDEEIDNDTIDKFDNDDEYFYKRVKMVA